MIASPAMRNDGSCGYYLDGAHHRYVHGKHGQCRHAAGNCAPHLLQRATMRFVTAIRSAHFAKEEGGGHAELPHVVESCALLFLQRATAHRKTAIRPVPLTKACTEGTYS